MAPRQEPPGSGLGSPSCPLAWDGAPAAAAAACVLRGHSLLSAQIVQRSLSGGFLTQDRALLAANARSMFDEAIDTTCCVGEGRPTAQGGSTYSQEKRPEASCELWSCEKVCLATFYKAHAGAGRGRRGQLEQELLRDVLRWVRGAGRGKGRGRGRPHRACPRLRGRHCARILTLTLPQPQPYRAFALPPTPAHNANQNPNPNPQARPKSSPYSYPYPYPYPYPFP